ncbi:MAG: hypothetical protein KBC64_07045 [Simkaniaceae bacterium]|nr:hypothetical protein [Simkaniaceae bacterium]
MKKYIIVLFILSSQLFALYNDNPSAPGLIENGLFFKKDDWIGIATQYEYSHVINRRLNGIDQFAYDLNQGTIVINLLKRFDLYGSLGAMKGAVSQTSPASRRLNYTTQSDLAWGAGARALVYQWNRFSIGLDGKFEHSYLRVSHLDINGTPVVLPHHRKMDYREWQIGLGFSYATPILIPYAVANYSLVGVHADLPDYVLYSTQNRRKFGLSLGTTVTNSEIFSLNIEARLVDELGMTVAGRFQF